VGDVIYCKRCRGRTPGRPKGIEDFAIAVGGPCVRKKKVNSGQSPKSQGLVILRDSP